MSNKDFNLNCVYILYIDSSYSLLSKPTMEGPRTPEATNNLDEKNRAFYGWRNEMNEVSSNLYGLGKYFITGTTVPQIFSKWSVGLDCAPVGSLNSYVSLNCNFSGSDFDLVGQMTLDSVICNTGVEIMNVVGIQRY